MKRSQRNSLIIALLSLPIFAGDIALVAQGKLPIFQALIPFTLGFVVFFLIIILGRRRDDEKIPVDERSLKIQGKAYTLSWWIGFYFIVLFMLNDQLGLLALSVRQILAYVVVAQMGSFWAIKTVLNKKGDVE
jgi:hypothetical protein